MAICKGSAQICALRVSRLNSTCGCVAGPNNAVATSAIIKVDASPEYETGTDFRMKNGCGDLCVTIKDCDRLVRMNLNLEICLRDMQLIELMTGATLYAQPGAAPGDPSEVFGYSRRGVGASCPDPVAIEVWTKVVDTSGACDPNPDGVPNWWRTIWPRATFTLGDVSFANEIATINFTGFAEPNPSFGDGCFNDIPTDFVLDPDSPEHTFLDVNGPPTPLACGYIDVPAQP